MSLEVNRGTRFTALLLGFSLLTSLALSSCSEPTRSEVPRCVSPPEVARSPSEKELDDFYVAMAYAVVFKDWQKKGPQQRGHNIGSVLADEQRRIVFWARNCNHLTQNGTQHGEVRLIQGYLSRARTYSLKKHSVYTTLEPCIQCAGMMTLTNIERVIYGQADPDFGGGLRRIQLDCSSCGGLEAYPRTVSNIESGDRFSRMLNDGYKASGMKSLTDYLLTDEAATIFQHATEHFLTTKPQFAENEMKLLEARRFFHEQVHEDYRVLQLAP